MTVAVLNEIQNVFKLQQAYKWELRKSKAEDRTAKLLKLKEAVQAHRQEIVDAVLQDVRKPVAEITRVEVEGVCATIDKTVAQLAAWMSPVQVAPTLIPGSRTQIIYESKGVCLIFGTWNYPFMTVIHPLVEAVAAGNCCMVKPSDMTPAIATVTAKVIRAVFEEKEVAAFDGDIEVANALLDLPFDHILFTGSTNVGKIVMAAAAKHLASVTLELGGKSPTIIDEGADLAHIASKIGWGKTFNGGQSCIAPDYVFLREELKDDFVAHVKAFVTKSYYKEQAFNAGNFTQIVNQRHFNRVKDLLEDAVAQGAKIELGGTFDAADRIIHPTVLTNVTHEMKIMQEEIFAPILPILSYTNLDDVIQYLQDHEKPLALYVVGSNEENIQKVLDRTSSGGVCVNDVMLHHAESNLPFGGVNASGIGSYHGYAGFKAFSHERSVLFYMPTQASK